VAALLLAACPRRPLSFGPQGEIQDPNEILRALASRSAKLHSLRSEVSFSADGSRGRGSTAGLVAAERPAHLHLELDDFFGNPAAVLTTEGTTLGVYQASSNTFATGLASPRNVASLVPVELPVSEAVDLLFGDPRPLGSRVQGFFVDRGRYSYALLFASGSGAQERRQRIDLDTETLVPVGETVEGWEPFEARFSNFESDSGLRVLRRLEVDSPGGEIKLSYKSLEINPPLSRELFIPRAPPGANQKVLDGEGLETAP
jgi:hypothetical protein